MENKEQLSYDVFISYRRKGGAEKAQLVKSEIRLRGIEEDRIFLDTHSLHDGDFEQKIKVAISQSENVVVIISNGCFDEVKETDFWYMEIKEALAQEKRVVPVFFDGITSFVNQNVPQELQELTKKNAVTYHHDYADAAFDKLANFIGFRNRRGCLFKYKGFLVSVTLVALLCFILAPMAFFIIYDNFGENNSYGGSEGYVAVNRTVKNSSGKSSAAVVPDVSYPDECGNSHRLQQPQNTQKHQQSQPTSNSKADLQEEQDYQIEEQKQKREEDTRMKAQEEESRHKEEALKKREEVARMKKEISRKLKAQIKEEKTRGKLEASPTSTAPHHANSVAPTAHSNASMMLMSTATVAQQGTTIIGANVNYGLHKDYKNFGVGAKIQYEFIDNWRGEASGNYFFKKDNCTMWDVNLNLHHLFRLSDKITVYPLAGVTLMDVKVDGSGFVSDFVKTNIERAATGMGISVDDYVRWANNAGQNLDIYLDDPSTSDTKVGFNVGAGIEYPITDAIKVNFEAKYQYRKDFKRLVISAGISLAL